MSTQVKPSPVNPVSQVHLNFKISSYILIKYLKLIISLIKLYLKLKFKINSDVVLRFNLTTN